MNILLLGALSSTALSYSPPADLDDGVYHYDPSTDKLTKLDEPPQAAHSAKFKRQAQVNPVMPAVTYPLPDASKGTKVWCGSGAVIPLDYQQAVNRLIANCQSDPSVGPQGHLFAQFGDATAFMCNHHNSETQQCAGGELIQAL